MRSIFKGIWLILTLNCEKSARLTSESFDRKLTWAERWAVRLHHAYCQKSRRLARQLQLLDHVLRQPPDRVPIDEFGVQLSPEAKMRIAAKLRDIQH